MSLKIGVDTLWCYTGQLLAARVGSVLLASDSRRSCELCLGKEHISALGMTLKIGVETLWCYTG